MQGEPIQVVCTAAQSSNHDRVLAVQKGEILTIVQFKRGWLKVQNAVSKQGWVPANITTPLQTRVTNAEEDIQEDSDHEEEDESSTSSSTSDRQGSDDDASGEMETEDDRRRQRHPKSNDPGDLSKSLRFSMVANTVKETRSKVPIFAPQLAPQPTVATKSSSKKAAHSDKHSQPPPLLPLFEFDFSRAIIPRQSTKDLHSKSRKEKDSEELLKNLRKSHSVDPNPKPSKKRSDDQLSRKSEITLSSKSRSKDLQQQAVTPKPDSSPQLKSQAQLRSTLEAMSLNDLRSRKQITPPSPPSNPTYSDAYGVHKTKPPRVIPEGLNDEPEIRLERFRQLHAGSDRESRSREPKGMSREPFIPPREPLRRPREGNVRHLADFADLPSLPYYTHLDQGYNPYPRGMPLMPPQFAHPYPHQHHHYGGQHQQHQKQSYAGYSHSPAPQYAHQMRPQPMYPVPQDPIYGFRRSQLPTSMAPVAPAPRNPTPIIPSMSPYEAYPYPSPYSGYMQHSYGA
jgi:hypothetical protein